MAITFSVDDVEPARTLLPTQSLAECFTDVFVLGGDPALRVVKQTSVHPLMAAVHLAFSEHRPLVLSPDAIWLTIAQGVAQHVRLNARTLAQQLTGGTSRRSIRVDWDGDLSSKPEEWVEIVSRFRQQIATETRSGLVPLLTCDFTTTTDIERIASEVVLMDLFSPFFEYNLGCICGIPEITLLGTPEDYRSIVRRVAYLDELGMAFWTSSLRPVADHLVRTAEGRPDTEFWRDIYKPRAAYGAERITGWIARLFPYVGSAGRYDRTNPLLPYSHEEIMSMPRPKGPYIGPGIGTGDIPTGLSSVHVNLIDKRTERWFGAVQFEGGLVAVQQRRDGYLVPLAGFAVCGLQGSDIRNLVNELRLHPDVVWIERDGSLTSPTAMTETLAAHPDLNALYHSIEQADLFEGIHAVRIRPPTELAELVFVLPSGFLEVSTLIADLGDGSCLAFGRTSKGNYVVKVDKILIKPLDPSLRNELPSTYRLQNSSGPVPEAHEYSGALDGVSVVGQTFAEVLQLLLAGGGEVPLPVQGRLKDLLRPYHLEPLPPEAFNAGL